MKFLPLIALALSLFVPRWSDSELEHRVQAGTKLRKTLEHSSCLVGTLVAVTIDGEEQPVPETHATVGESELRLVVHDEYGATRDGTLSTLTRTLVSYDDCVAFGNDDESLHFVSPLVDQPVRWKADNGGFEASFEGKALEGEREDKWLEGLLFDLEGKGLLPGPENAAHEGWTVDVEAIRELLALGGDFAAEPAGEIHESALVLRTTMPLPLLGDLEGDLVARIDEIDEETHVATVLLKGDVSGRVDGTRLLLALAKETNKNEYEDVRESSLETEMALEGSFSWDLDGGRLIRLELNANVERVQRFVIEFPPIDRTVSMTKTFVGEAEWLLESTPVED